MKKIKNIEIIIPLCLVTFMLISTVTIKSSSYIISEIFANLYLKQLSWYFLGFIMFFVVLVVDNKNIYKASSYFYFISCFLLILVLIIGEKLNSSSAWLNIGPLSFQPSEFAKIGLILYIGKILNDYHFKRKKNIKTEFILILKVFLITLIPSVLVFLEPDTGAVISYFLIAMIMLFVSGIKYRWYAILISLAGIFIFIFIYLYINNTELILNTVGSNIYYRINRIIEWKTSSGMQLENSLTSIGTSGLHGHGLNNTPLYFPEPYTDFIFAVYASNYGLVGASLLILLIFIFDSRIISIGIKSSKTLDKYIISGIVASLIFYQIQNISMTIGLLPITGVPLPFISYGGSSLIIYMILTALVVNAHIKK